MNLAIVYKLYLGIKKIRFEKVLSYSSIVPRRENNIKGIHWLWTSKWNSCYSWFPNSLQYSLRGRIWSDLISNWSILILPHFIEGAPQNVRTGGGYALHRERFYKSYNPAENIGHSWEHRKTPKIIWYHPENNWGPTIDNLVQLEEDFNSRKTSSENSWKTVGKHWKTAENIGKHLKSSDIILRTTEDPS